MLPVSQHSTLNDTKTSEQIANNKYHEDTSSNQGEYQDILVTIAQQQAPNNNETATLTTTTQSNIDVDLPIEQLTALIGGDETPSSAETPAIDEQTLANLQAQDSEGLSTPVTPTQQMANQPLLKTQMANEIETTSTQSATVSQKEPTQDAKNPLLVDTKLAQPQSLPDSTSLAISAASLANTGQMTKQDHAKPVAQERTTTTALAMNTQAAASAIPSKDLTLEQLSTLPPEKLNQAHVTSLALHKSDVVVDPKLTPVMTDAKITNELLAVKGDGLTTDMTLAERSQTTTGKYEWSMLKLDQQRQNWSKQLFNTLQDRIEMQVNQQIKQAKIRLDPPDLGRLELTVRMEGDRLSVNVVAANNSIRDALLESNERLRQELANQFGSSVDVNVGSENAEQSFKNDEESVALTTTEPSETQNIITPKKTGWLNALA